MPPNLNYRSRNIARAFATNQKFNDLWSKFIYGLGKNGSGSRHLSAIVGVTNLYYYPSGITNLTKVRFEVELVMIHNGEDASYMVFHVGEHEGTTETGGVPYLEYVASFKVPKSFNLDAITRSHFENPVIDDTDETFAIDAGMGSSLIVLSKQGLQKINEFSSSQP